MPPAALLAAALVLTLARCQVSSPRACLVCFSPPRALAHREKRSPGISAPRHLAATFPPAWSSTVTTTSHLGPRDARAPPAPAPPALRGQPFPTWSVATMSASAALQATAVFPTHGSGGAPLEVGNEPVAFVSLFHANISMECMVQAKSKQCLSYCPLDGASCSVAAARAQLFRGKV